MRPVGEWRLERAALVAVCMQWCWSSGLPAQDGVLVLSVE